MVIETNKYVKHLMDFQNFVQKNMDSLFVQLNIKPSVFVGIGAVMALVGLLKIIGTGISIVIWVAVLMTGISAAKYGMKKGGFSVPSEIATKFSQAVKNTTQEAKV